MILDRNINKEQQDLQLSTNLSRVFVLYKTPPKIQNEDPLKIVINKMTRNTIIKRSRNKEQQDLRLSTNLSRFVHNPTKSKKRRPLENRLEITCKLEHTQRVVLFEVISNNFGESYSQI